MYNVVLYKVYLNYIKKSITFSTTKQITNESKKYIYRKGPLVLYCAVMSWTNKASLYFAYFQPYDIK